MAFTDTVDNLLVKAHLSHVPRPIIASALILFFVAALVACVQFWTLFSPRVLDVQDDPHISYAADDIQGSQSASKGVSNDSASANTSTKQSAVSTGSESATLGESPIAEPIYVYVHVAGAVMSPGVYAVQADSRVQAAIEKAGGMTPGAASDAVNLARVVQDGEQIYIPTTDELNAGVLLGEEKTQPKNEEASSKATKERPVNINTATAAELESLPGVGPSTAQKIISDRDAKGPFAAPEDLMRVSGIGEKKFAELKDFVCI